MSDSMSDSMSDEVGRKSITLGLDFVQLLVLDVCVRDQLHF